MVNIVPYVFPDNPTSWIEMSKPSNSTTFTAPEDGWFQFIGIAASGKAGYDNWAKSSSREWYAAGGGGGGGAGGIVVSIFPLYKGETVSISISQNVTISHDGETATATSGGVGGNGSTSGSMGLHGIGGSGGNGGSASGGNTANQPGSRGGTGGSGESESKSQALAQATKGSSVSNNYNGYITKSQGNGNSSNPTSAYAVILRGNTNIPLDQQNALDITSISLDISELQQMQTDVLMGNISVD